MNLRVFRNHNASLGGEIVGNGFHRSQTLSGGLQAGKKLSEEHKARISEFPLSIREFVKDKGEVGLIIGKDEFGKNEVSFGLRLEKKVREFATLLCEIAKENPNIGPGGKNPAFVVSVLGGMSAGHSAGNIEAIKNRMLIVRPTVELKAIAHAKDDSYHSINMKFTIYPGFPEYMLLKVESDGAFSKIDAPLGTGAYLYAYGRKNNRIFESRLAFVAEAVLNFSP